MNPYWRVLHSSQHIDERPNTKNTGLSTVLKADITGGTHIPRCSSHASDRSRDQHHHQNGLRHNIEPAHNTRDTCARTQSHNVYYVDKRSAKQNLSRKSHAPLTAVRCCPPHFFFLPLSRRREHAHEKRDIRCACEAHGRDGVRQDNETRDGRRVDGCACADKQPIGQRSEEDQCSARSIKERSR